MKKSSFPTAAELDASAEKVIKKHALGVLSTGFLPVPIFDLAMFTFLQVNMIMEICALYGYSASKQRVKTWVSAIIGSSSPFLLGPKLLGSLFKLVPGVGTLSGVLGLATTAGATTYALGILFRNHFAAGGTPDVIDTQQMKQSLTAEQQKGRKILEKEHAVAAQEPAAEAPEPVSEEALTNEPKPAVANAAQVQDLVEPLTQVLAQKSGKPVTEESLRNHPGPAGEQAAQEQPPLEFGVKGSSEAKERVAEETLVDVPEPVAEKAIQESVAPLSEASPPAQKTVEPSGEEAVTEQVLAESGVTEKAGAVRLPAQSVATEDAATKQELVEAAQNPESAPVGESPAKKEPSQTKLALIKGIGPKIERLLKQAGIQNFTDLAATEVQRLEEILDRSGSNFNFADPVSWPKQAALARDRDWSGLERYQEQ